jgi:hypothetical protein
LKYSPLDIRLRSETVMPLYMLDPALSNWSIAPNCKIGRCNALMHGGYGQLML